MRLFTELLLSGFRENIRYRLAMFASVVANVVFGIIRASLLFATIQASGADVAGYDLAAAATYVWVGQGLIGPIDIWGNSSAKTADKIRSGALAVDLLRPVNPLYSWWAADLGRMISQIPTRLVTMLVLGAVITGIRLPHSPLIWLSFTASLILATTVTYLFFHCVVLGGLWWVETRGQRTFASVLVNLLSGFLIPVQWFPEWLAAIARWSPFPSMMQSPIDLLTGLADGRIMATLATQLVWALLLAGLAAWILRAGSKRLEVQGG